MPKYMVEITRTIRQHATVEVETDEEYSHIAQWVRSNYYDLELPDDEHWTDEDEQLYSVGRITLQE